MGENSAIEWTDATFNPWWGCTKISGACDHCYAESLSRRTGFAKWGHGEPRRRTSEKNWRGPLDWDRRAAKAGKRLRVFCASMADWADSEAPDEWRADLFHLIEATPNLDWLLLSKRHALVRRYLPAKPLSNVRVGMTVENEDLARIRLSRLSQLALDGWKTFVSYEPALGPVNWWPWLDPEGIAGGCIQWLIAGGESGHGARPPHPDWFRAARDACQRAGVPFLFKQWGEWKPVNIARCEPKRLHTWSMPSHQYMERVGKARAGRLLDGREWSETPA